ncbi:MFS transporter [Fodinicola acaciae]|uniref:MFS transporter n=1 Tax=Fodinicola acaciae TaxID=2681555 RepID=UPI0013D23E22|nr:MFS transporter [Fodinicola acaciae]
MPAVTAKTAGRPTLSVAIVLAAAFLVWADSSIVNVAVPVLRSDLHATFGQAQLVAASYQIAYAALLVVGGRLGDRFGRRRLFLIGLAGFAVASLGCGLAPTAQTLIALRAGQGVAAALMFPQTLSVIQVVVPAARRPLALAVFGITSSLATIAGPLICGVLLRADLFGLTWRPAFLVNLPVCALGLLMALGFLPESRSEDTRTIDIPAAVLVASALTATIVGLVEGNEAGWPWWSIGLLASAAPLFVLFHLRCRAVHRRGGTALVPPPLWRDRTFVVGLLVFVLSYVCVPAFFLYLSVTLQDGFGQSALGSALIATPYALGAMAGYQLSVRLRRALGGRGCVSAGTAAWLVGSAGLLLAVGQQSLTGPVLLSALVVSGLGLGCMLAPLLGVILGGVPPAHAGAASGILSTGQQIGGVLGIALVGMAFTQPLSAGTESAHYRAALFAAVVVITIAVAVNAVLARFLPDDRP